jgi:anti-sigma factor RsiW
MNNHLSQDQFERCLLLRAGPAELEHLSNCPGCRAEFEHCSRLLALFRSAIRHRVDDQVTFQSSAVLSSDSAATGIPKWRWALVAVGFFAVVMSPFFMTAIKPPERMARVSTKTSAEAVMERLNRHLSRTMPAPMEPVMSLIPSEEIATKPGRVQ